MNAVDIKRQIQAAITESEQDLATANKNHDDPTWAYARKATQAQIREIGSELRRLKAALIIVNRVVAGRSALDRKQP
jgi:hypothetical protein